jgi:amidase
MSGFWRLSAKEIATRVRRRECSAREVTLDALARLDAVNPRINAAVHSRAADAMSQADRVDQVIAAGRDPGLLAGVPVTVKVNVDQAGFASDNGARCLADKIALTNSPVVDSLQRAGAVVIGRTNTPAFSYRWFTDNRLHGRTWNPRDRAITPGGSSGGAGAAVASGIGALAHGTDIAGSIRYPAYACGVHGLRPSLGRVAAYNATTGDRLIGPQLMAVSGPLARTVDDLRLALEAMAAPDWRDPWWVPAPLVGPAVERRVALCRRPASLAIDPAVDSALTDAAARLVDAGWVLDEIDECPPLEEAARLQVRLWLGDRYAEQLALAEKEGDPGAIACLRGQAAALADFDAALLSTTLQRRVALMRLWSEFFKDYPLLLLPVSAEPPFPVDLDLVDGTGYARVWRAQLPMVGPPLMGLPGLTVTTGTVGGAGANVLDAGVPIGVQLLADRYREDLLLTAGAAIEARGPAVAAVDPV